MRKELENIEQIELYLTHQLDQDSRHAFENQLHQNPILAEQVEAHQMLLKAIRRAQFRKEVLAVSQATNFWNIWTQLGLGILILTFVSVGFTFLMKNQHHYNAKQLTNIETRETIATFNDSSNVQQTEIAESKDTISQKSYSAKKTISKNIPTHDNFQIGGVKTFVEPTIQHFVVDPQKGETIEGQQGTLIIIPPNAFVDSNNNLATSAIDFELVEALTLKDMILYNLTTTSNGKQLETGGMFYINASNNGTPVKLNPNAPIYTEIPTQSIKKGMLAFDSEIDINGNINWVTPKPLKKYLTKVDLNLLDFLPKGFANGVAENLPFKNYNKATPKLIDSLYYSLDDISEANTESTTFIPQESSNRKRNGLGVRWGAERTIDFKNKNASSINGTIIDESGKPMPFVNITLRKDNIVRYGTNSDFDGNYTFDNISPGNYILEISFVGYQTSQQALAITDQNITVPTITLFEGIIPENQSTSFGKRKSKIKTIKGKKKSYKKCGIRPLSIKTIKSSEFEHTYIATKEMEERIFYLHQLNNGDSLLGIYIDNLGNNLYLADSIVANSLTGSMKKQFLEFYNQKLTNIKDANNIYQQQLSNFYNKKKKQYSNELNQLKQALDQKTTAELKQLKNLIENNRKAYQKTILTASKPNKLSNFPIKQTPQRSVVTTPSYAAQWTSLGWKNIDKYTHLLANGSETVQIETNQHDGFSRIFQYLNTIKTITPLLNSNNIAQAKFPKRSTVEAKKMSNTYTFSLTKRNKKLYWGITHYNPYTDTTIHIEEKETPLTKIKDELSLVGSEGLYALNYFEDQLKRTIKQKNKQLNNRKRLLEEKHKREELFKKYQAQQNELNLEIERRNRKELEQKRFTDTLRSIAFPCFENEQNKTENLNISAPNIFTPDGDGINDNFIVNTKANIKSYKMTITNKKGKLLYTTTSMNKPWNGIQPNSRKSYPNDIYLWNVQIIDNNDKEALFNGVVQLVNNQQ
ncbi:MAG: carboxypeptidase regulatory-like domain-containing protein [Flavobacteriales bacterium]|jgi:gliding motility-associated-like protein|nr:carboxypeptidase regulatory-like domain-containing protein [Flavobacteriales bacterium]